MARVFHALTSSRRSRIILIVTVVALICSALGLSQALSWFHPPQKALAAIPSWDDLTGEIPADADNAAVVYERAFSMVDVPYPAGMLVSDILHQGHAPDAEQLAGLESLLAGSDEALALVHEAADRPECAFSLVPRDGIGGDFPHLRGSDDVLLLEIARAFIRADRGDLSGALSSLADAVHCARHSFEGMPALKTFLGEARAMRMVANATRIIIRDADLAPTDVESLADALRAVDLQADLITAMRAEGAWGMAVLDAADGEAEGQISAVLKTTGTCWHRYRMPGVYLSANRRVFAERMVEIIELSSRPYRASTAVLDNWRLALPSYAQITATLLPDPRVPMQNRDEAIAWQRMCLAALEIAACDTAPRTLATLRPPVEDVWVRDIFSGDHLRYRAGADGFTLYSIGRDLDDDDGTAQRHIGGVASTDGDLVWSTEA